MTGMKSCAVEENNFRAAYVSVSVSVCVIGTKIVKAQNYLNVTIK